MHIEREDVSSKTSGVAMLLALGLGMYGAHRIYVGKYFSGILMFLFGGGITVARFLIESGKLTFGSFYILFIAYGLVYVVALYDVAALYHDAFLDGKGKIVLCNSHKDECFGRTKDQKVIDLLESIAALLIVFIVWAVFYSINILIGG